ncbi:MAG: hypothetical protein K1W14_13700 [Muribaculaceae bacterium]
MRKRKDFVRLEGVRSARLVVIASEGSKSGVPWLKQRMRNLLGSYSESNYEACHLIPFAPLAMKRARALDANPQDRWPQSIGTRVYLLMDSITTKR